MRESQAKFFAGLLEQLKFIKLIKINAVQEEINKRADEKFDKFNHAVVRNQRVNYLYSGMDGIISTIAQIVLFVIGGLQVLYGNFTIGMFTIFTAYFNLMLNAARYFYGFNATFKRGKLYAIVGANGAGKSTLTNIISGLYINNVSGEIAYNNTDIRLVDMIAARRKNIGIAAQEPELVSDSILYNITYGNHAQLDNAHFSEYIKILNMTNFIDKHGLHFEINETNNNISGGEKQKIAILSVLYKNPEVMIFDEPTSALDADTASRLINYLQRIKNKKIVIVITHDTSIRDICDEQLLFARI